MNQWKKGSDPEPESIMMRPVGMSNHEKKKDMPERWYDQMGSKESIVCEILDEAEMQ